jgi:hypothetical protein
MRRTWSERLLGRFAQQPSNFQLLERPATLGDDDEVWRELQ